MADLTRRGLLGAGAALGCAAALVGGPQSAAAEQLAGQEAVPPAGACPPAPGPVTVRPSDPRYRDLTSRGFNGRFIGRPESVRLAWTTEQVAAVVREAVRTNKRIAVRSGGHSLEGFVDRPEVQLILDLGEMDAVYFDARHRAFAIEAGATLGHVYRSLYLGWGVTIPGGLCPAVGLGGHVAGGGYGPLSRQYGTTVDHLYGVEVVVVDRSGRVRTVVATRRRDDPNRDLWWAHTGGGGGNFGVVTRYWFRSPDARGADPGELLPRPPAGVLRSYVTWPWEKIDERAFVRLVRNHGQWHARNSAPGTPYASLWSQLALNPRAAGVPLNLDAQVNGALPNSQRLMDDYIKAVSDGVGVEPAVQPSRPAWMKHATTDEFGNIGTYNHSKSKAAYLRKPWSERQIATIHRYLTDASYYGWGQVHLTSYGGQSNAVSPTATAMPQRDSILKAWWSAFWGDPGEADANVDWLRRFYRDVYADTGGVPVPNDSADGSFINYPDADLADPRWNTSGVPWHALYYKGNYRRLQRIKARWDPRDVFRHPLSIQPPG